MASTEAKAKRKAIALNEMDRLSGLLGEKLKIEVPNVRPTHRDPEFQSIQRVEAVNELLSRMLQSLGVETKADEVPEEQEVDLEHMKKADLLELAQSKGVDVDKTFTKAEIIEALNA
jgi:hypothetical protein